MKSYGVVCNIQCSRACLRKASFLFPGATFRPNKHPTGIKEYSDWPTIPQLYVDKEFVGGCDILINMHKDGSLADLLSQKKVLATEEGDGVEDAEHKSTDGDQGGEAGGEAEHTPAGGDKEIGGDSEGQKADEARLETEQSTGARSKDAKGQSS